jgi:hypothetical protein
VCVKVKIDAVSAVQCKHWIVWAFGFLSACMVVMAYALKPGGCGCYPGCCYKIIHCYCSSSMVLRLARAGATKRFLEVGLSDEEEPQLELIATAAHIHTSESQK